MSDPSRDKSPETDIEAQADPHYSSSQPSAHERSSSGSQASGQAPGDTDPAQEIDPKKSNPAGVVPEKDVRKIRDNVEDNPIKTRSDAQPTVTKLTGDSISSSSSTLSSREHRRRNHDRAFVKRMRNHYKKRVIDVTGGRVCVNLAELNRVILEYSQRELVEVAFEFGYGRADYDSDVEDFTSRSSEYLMQYGMLVSSPGLTTSWLHL